MSREYYPMKVYILIGFMCCLFAAFSENRFLTFNFAAIAFYYGSTVGILMERRKNK